MYIFPHRPPRWVFVVSAVGRCVVFGLFWFLGLHFISEAIIVVVRRPGRPGRAGFFLVGSRPVVFGDD